MDSLWALGVDMGGTHVSVAVVNATDGVVLPHTRCRSALNSMGTASEILDTCARVIKQAWEAAGIKASPVGIAMPGPFDYEKGICLINKQEKYRSLFQLNMKQLLAAQLGLAPADVRFMNDASAFLTGEIVAGTTPGAVSAIGITLGTGLGSAFYQNGGVADAGLWQMPFKAGIAEDYLSTRWFINAYQLHFSKQISGVKELTLLPDREEIGVIFDEFSLNLAAFIVLAAGKFNCSNVIVGGNISKAAAFFEERTSELLRKSNCAATLAIAMHGEDAAMIGAAGLFQQKNVVKIC